MTRETKIGLLVGLAFILVVGILLSEHITGATEHPAAPLADAGHGVRNGMGAPGAAADEPARPDLARAEPTVPVPSPADLTPKQPVSQIAVVPPQPAQGGATVVVAQNNTPAQPTQQPAVAPQPIAPQGETVVVRAPTDPFSNDPVARVAKQMGEPLVPVTGTTPAGKPAATVTKVAANTTHTTSAREYKAQAGDTLSRLAAQLPGGNIKANRDAVVAMNPTLQKDPNRVLSGHVYLLPTGTPSADKSVAVAEATAPKATVPAVVTPAKTEAKTTVAEKPVDPKAIASGQRVYIVKAGDTLSKIASAELGSKSEVATIQKMNADVLKTGDKILVNMKLKLPATKMMASASIR